MYTKNEKLQAQLADFTDISAISSIKIQS